MSIVVRLLQRPVHRYERHKHRRPGMHPLRCRNIFHQRQRILLHRLDQLHSRSKDSRQRHRNHGPYLRSLPDWEILYRVQPEHLHELDRMQRHHRNREQCRFYDSG